MDPAEFFKSGQEIHKRILSKDFKQKTLNDRRDEFKNIRKKTRNNTIFSKRNIDKNMTPYKTPEPKMGNPVKLNSSVTSNVNTSFSTSLFQSNNTGKGSRFELLKKWKQEKEKRLAEERSKMKPIFKVCHVLEKPVSDIDIANNVIKGKPIKKNPTPLKSTFAPPNHQFRAPTNLKPIFISQSKPPSTRVTRQALKQKEQGAKMKLDFGVKKSPVKRSNSNIRNNVSRVNIKKNNVAASTSSKVSPKKAKKVENPIEIKIDDVDAKTPPKKARGRPKKNVVVENKTPKKIEVVNAVKTQKSNAKTPQKVQKTPTNTKSTASKTPKSATKTVPKTPTLAKIGTVKTPKSTVPKTPNSTVPKTPKSTVPKTPNSTVPKTPKSTVPRTPKSAAKPSVKKTPKNVAGTPKNIKKTPHVANNWDVDLNETSSEEKSRKKSSASTDYTVDSICLSGLITPEKQDNDDVFPVYVSPFVTVSRGKNSARKEFHQRNSMSNKSISESPSFESRDVSQHSSPRAGAEYFSRKLQREIDRIEGVCSEWQLYKDESDIPNEAQDMIDVAIGQSRLLIAKKFEQFRGLVEQCRTCDYKEKPITCKDLHGFWDMIYMQVEDLNKRFSNLVSLRSNNWEEIMPEKKVEVVAVKKARGRPASKKTKATSGLKDMIKAMRNKKNNLLSVENTGTEEKTFDGGYFSVKSPIKTCPGSAKRRSLRMSVLSAEAQKHISSPGLAIMRLTQSIKCGDGLTPGKSILKPEGAKSAKKSVLFKEDVCFEKLPKKSLSKAVLFQDDSDSNDENDANQSNSMPRKSSRLNRV